VLEGSAEVLEKVDNVAQQVLKKNNARLLFHQRKIGLKLTIKILLTDTF
jgi:hypothetical protein